MSAIWYYTIVNEKLYLHFFSSLKITCSACYLGLVVLGLVVTRSSFTNGVAFSLITSQFLSARSLLMKLTWSSSIFWFKVSRNRFLASKQKITAFCCEIGLTSSSKANKRNTWRRIISHPPMQLKIKKKRRWKLPEKLYFQKMYTMRCLYKKAAQHKCWQIINLLPPPPINILFTVVFEVTLTFFCFK